MVRQNRIKQSPYVAYGCQASLGLLAGSDVAEPPFFAFTNAHLFDFLLWGNNFLTELPPVRVLAPWWLAPPRCIPAAPLLCICARDLLWWQGAETLAPPL